MFKFRANPVPFYIRKMNIWGFWYLLGSWTQSPMAIEEKLQNLSFALQMYHFSLSITFVEPQPGLRLPLLQHLWVERLPSCQAVPQALELVSGETELPGLWGRIFHHKFRCSSNRRARRNGSQKCSWLKYFLNASYVAGYLLVTWGTWVMKGGLLERRVFVRWRR